RADDGPRDRLADDLRLPRHLERPARSAHLPRHEPLPAVHGRDHRTGHLARRRVAVPDRRGRAPDVAAAAGVHLPAAIFRARHHERLGQGIALASNPSVVSTVVLMTCHDIGRTLHCYGVETVRSPHLDELAAAGAVFTRAFCTAPQCSPSRASIATGMYPHSNGVMGLAHVGFDWEISAGVPHAAAIFHDAGFESHLFGGQHVSLHPERLGFDAIHSPGHDHGNMTGPTVANAVEQFLGERGSGGRLYLEINFDDTHRPYPDAIQPLDWPVIPPYLPAGPEAASEMRGAEAAIAEMDEAAGRVLAALEASGRAASAMVVFTTDHGLAMPRAKCTLYDAGLEVALIGRLPGAAPAVHDELISNIDILPTILEAAAVPVPAHVQGRSFLPLLAGGAYEPR